MPANITLDTFAAMPGRCIAFDYTNHRGEQAKRTAIIRGYPIWGTTEWHKEPQWFLSMFDTDKQEPRDFAMKDMRNVVVV